MEGLAPKDSLFYFNSVVLKAGRYIQKKRQELADEINRAEAKSQSHKYVLEYMPSVMSEERQEEYLDKELIVGYSLIGPQKDDFSVSMKARKHEGLKERNLATFGSRGEQRMTILWLKLQQLQFIEQKSGERPVFLLDDILSELDQEHSKDVLGLMGQQQTFITTTNAEMFERDEGIEVIHL